MNQLGADILILTVILLAFDGCYLYANTNMFRNLVFQIQGKNMTIRPESVVICYFALIVGLYYFIIKDNKSPLEAFLLGVVIYGVYDSTNYATLTNYTASFALKDTLWGGILFALVTFSFQQIKNRQFSKKGSKIHIGL